MWLNTHNSPCVAQYMCGDVTHTGGVLKADSITTQINFHLDS